MPGRSAHRSVTTHPLTSDRWDDLARLFGQSSTTRACWCMWFRRSGPEYREASGRGNEAAFENVVRTAAAPPGVLAYLDDQPVGWCAVAPRAEYIRLQRSPITKPVDDRSPWAVTCFFIASQARDRGVAHALLDAAASLAVEHGAEMIEGYPVDPAIGSVSADSAYHGLVPWFDRAGFHEVARRNPKRPIMRRAC